LIAANSSFRVGLPSSRCSLGGFGRWHLTRRTRCNARNKRDQRRRSGWCSTRRLNIRHGDLGMNNEIEIFAFLLSLIFERSNSFDSITNLEWS
jgi:hypothetical protein